MNWLPVKYATESLALVTLAVCAVVVTAKLDAVLYHLDGAVTRLEAIETKANATLVNLDKASATWASASGQQTAAIQDLADDAHGTLSQADLALESIPPISNATVDELRALKGTTDAGTQLELQAVTTLQTMDSKTGMLLDAYTASGRDLDALIQENSPSVRTVLQNSASMTGSGAGILADGKVVSDKITYDYTHPVKWYQQPWKLVTLGVDAALLAK